MSISYSNFFVPAVLGTVAATLFTVGSVSAPVSTLLRGGRIRFVNTSAAAVTVTAYAVPPAGAAGPGNAFISAKTIASNDYIDVDVPVMPNLSFLQALSGAATSVTAHMISGSIFA